MVAWYMIQYVGWNQPNLISKATNYTGLLLWKLNKNRKAETFFKNEFGKPSSLFMKTYEELEDWKEPSGPIQWNEVNPT